MSKEPQRGEEGIISLQIVRFGQQVASYTLLCQHRQAIREEKENQIAIRRGGYWLLSGCCFSLFLQLRTCSSSHLNQETSGGQQINAIHCRKKSSLVYKLVAMDRRQAHQTHTIVQPFGSPTVKGAGQLLRIISDEFFSRALAIHSS